MLCVEIEIKCLRGAKNPLLIMTVTGKVWRYIFWARKQSDKKEETRNRFSGLSVKKQTKPQQCQNTLAKPRLFPYFLF